MLVSIRSSAAEARGLACRVGRTAFAADSALAVAASSTAEADFASLAGTLATGTRASACFFSLAFALPFSDAPFAESSSCMFLSSLTVVLVVKRSAAAL